MQRTLIFSLATKNSVYLQIYTDFFIFSNLMDGTILWAASFTLYKLVTKNLHLGTKFLQKGDLRIFVNSGLVVY